MRARADAYTLVVVNLVQATWHQQSLMLFVLQGRCGSPAPSSFELKEAVPPGACGVLVKEDFLDVPLGSGGQGGGLLLDSLYVAVASPAGSGSSVLLLHVRPSSPKPEGLPMLIYMCGVCPQRPRCMPVNNCTRHHDVDARCNP